MSKPDEHDLRGECVPGCQTCGAREEFTIPAERCEDWPEASNAHPVCPYLFSAPFVRRCSLDSVLLSCISKTPSWIVALRRTDGKCPFTGPIRLVLEAA